MDREGRLPTPLAGAPETADTSIAITTEDTSITITGIYALTAAIAVILIVGVLALIFFWQRAPYPEGPAHISWPDE